MFAPRHEITAHELARVLRPGGRLGITAWTPDGAMGTFFKTVGPYLPPPSPLAEPPVLWGSQAHVEELFRGTGVELEFEYDAVTPTPFDTIDDAIDFISTKFGPLIMVRQLTEASGRWPELRDQLATLFERQEPTEYLITLGRKDER
jgi:hypothetical protein